MKTLKKTFMNALVVTQVTGTPQGIYNDLNQAQTPIKITQNLKLSNDVHLTLKDHDVLDLKINDQYRILALPKTKINFSGIQQKEGYSIRSMTLIEGLIYLESSLSTQDLESTPLQIKSDFFEMTFSPSSTVKALFEMDLSKSEIFICNGDAGNLKIKFFDHEISPELEKNQGIHFKGVYKDNRLVYDLLLEGRKVPQGKWSEKEKCSLDVIQKYQKKAKAKLNKIKETIAAEKKKKELEQLRKDSQFLCRQPYGNLNQCFYEIKGGECLKSRCNAEGKWIFETKLSLSKCQLNASESSVKDCN